MSWCFSVFWCLNFISWQSCCVWFDRCSRSTNSDNFVSLIMLYKEDISMKRINLIWLHQHLMDKDKLVLSIKYLKKQLQNSVMIRSIAQMDLLSLLLQWWKCQTHWFFFIWALFVSLKMCKGKLSWSPINQGYGLQFSVCVCLGVPSRVFSLYSEGIWKFWACHQLQSFLLLHDLVWGFN